METELEWGHVLSLGEQQRIAFLRLLLHQPALAFLDEATGACDENTEAALYGLLQSSCQTFVSVGKATSIIHSRSCAWCLHVLACATACLLNCFLKVMRDQQQVPAFASLLQPAAAQAGCTLELPAECKKFPPCGCMSMCKQKACS